MGAKARWRIQQGPQGGSYWIEHLDFLPGLGLFGRCWQRYPYRNAKAYDTLPEAADALRAYIAGPRTLAIYDKHGDPV